MNALVLCAVFHIDVPTGNVPLAELRGIARHPMVANVIPLSLGDAYRGFRIVGTTPAYVDHYAGRLAEGRLWERSMEAVMGSRAARETGLRVGGSFDGSRTDGSRCRLAGGIDAAGFPFMMTIRENKNFSRTGHR